MDKPERRLETRRESNRQSARRHYEKKRRLIDQLRAEAADLETQLSAHRPFLRYDYKPNKKTESDKEDPVEVLRRENAALRKRLERFQSWETHLNLNLKQFRVAASASTSPSDPSAAQQKPSQQRVGIKKPLTVKECHAIVREAYPVIVTFNASGRDGCISTGASVFGWTDQRRVDNGLLKFSLSKVNTQQSPEEVTAMIWSMLTSPGGYNEIISQSMGMNTEIVQVVDHSNVVMLQECQVHGSADGIPTLTVMRAFVLLTLFATESGYILLTYGLDPERAEYPPNYLLVPLKDERTIVKYESQQMFCWCVFNQVEGAPNHCHASFVGTFPVEGANFVHWAIEVLLLVLRVENILLGPQLVLQQEE